MLYDMLMKDLIRTQLSVEPDLTADGLRACLNSAKEDALEKNDSFNFAVLDAAIAFCAGKSMDEIKKIL